MLTACVGHSAFERDCDSIDFVTACAASIPIVSSHAGRTFTDIIITLRLRSSATSVRSISDAILVPGFRIFA
jgi:hypothetical protein